jgi:hypothetical protein
MVYGLLPPSSGPEAQKIAGKILHPVEHRAAQVAAELL